MSRSIFRLFCLVGLIGTAAVGCIKVEPSAATEGDVVDARGAGASREASDNEKKERPAPKGVPEKVMKVLAYVDENGEAMSGYEGGRSFGNFEKRLPQTEKSGKRIKYREWDVNPLRRGVNRGVERLITGSDGSAYYTGDHYETFKHIR